MDQSRKSRGLLLIAVGAISFAAVFFRSAAPTHPLIQAALRLFLASLVLLPWFLSAVAKGKMSRQVLRAALLCGVWYAIHFGAWVTSLTLTTVAASVTLVTATPLVLGLIGWMTGKDAPLPREWGGLGLGALGIAVIGWSDLSMGSEALKGDALALLGALGMAGYLLTCRKVAKDLDVLAFTSVATGVASLILVCGASLWGVPLEVAGWESFFYLAAAALIPQCIGHVALTWASRALTPVVVGTATLGEPIGAALLAWLWFSETPSVMVMGGSAITLMGLVVALRAKGDDGA